MKIRSLPDFPVLFADFAEATLPAGRFLQRAAGIEDVAARSIESRGRELPRYEIARILSGQTDDSLRGIYQANLEALAKPGTVAVLASCRPEFAGGMLYNLFKLVCAARIAAELKKKDVMAVPICWIERGLSDESSEGPEATGALPASPPIETRIREAERMASASLEPELERALTDSYSPRAGGIDATAFFLSRVLSGLGILFLDPDAAEFRVLMESRAPVAGPHLEERIPALERRKAELESAGYGWSHMPSHSLRGLCQPGIRRLELERVLPVSCHVVDENEVQSLALAGGLFPGAGGAQPLLWPRPSATLVDSRSRKTLDRYEIGLDDLLIERNGLPGRLAQDGSSENAVRKLEALAREIEDVTGGLKNSVLPDSPLAHAIVDSTTRMIYQINKLRDRFAASALQRRQVAERQVQRARDALVPGGHLQEASLGLLVFLMRYGHSLPELVFEKMDVHSTDHQIFYME